MYVFGSSAGAEEVPRVEQDPDVRRAGKLDTWHFFRTGGRSEDVHALAPGTITALQVSDARAELFGVWENARVRDRMLPGDGDIPLVEILQAVFDAHPVRDVGVEVFDTTRSAPELAAGSRTALDRVLAQLSASS